MPRRKKTNKIIGKTSSETMRNALRDIENSGLSVKAAAIRYENPRTTLRRYVDKIKDGREEIDWNSPVLPRLEPNYKVNKIFSQEEEENLSDYFQTMAKLHHGLNPRCARKPNPGKRVTIYDIADILGEADPLAFTARNCTSGFRSTGIFPFNPNVFNDDDFIASTVTDIQIKHKDGSNEDNLNQTIIDNEKVMIDMPSTSARDENSMNDKLIVLPTDLKPFPKATASDENKKFQRKKKKSEILTDTPVLERLQEEEKLKEARKSSLNKNPGVKRSLGDSLNLKPCTKPQKKRKLPESSSSDDESIEHLTDSEDIDIFAQSDEEDNHLMNDLSTITEGSFVLVKFPTKKTVKYYVGRILTKLNDEEFDITFFRHHGSHFISPNVPDISTVLAHDIFLHLMQPEKVGGTSRTANLFSFPVDLSSYNVN